MPKTNRLGFYMGEVNTRINVLQMYRLHARKKNADPEGTHGNLTLYTYH